MDNSYKQERFLGKSAYEPGGFEYEKQKKENKEANDAINSYKQKKIEETIKKILKPFIYNKYGKTYIGYYETEGALRVEGMILELGSVLSKIIDETEKQSQSEIRDKFKDEIEKINFYDWNEDTQRMIKDKIKETLNN